jgi:hypothetical protein
MGGAPSVFAHLSGLGLARLPTTFPYSDKDMGGRAKPHTHQDSGVREVNFLSRRHGPACPGHLFQHVRR